MRDTNPPPRKAGTRARRRHRDAGRDEERADRVPWLYRFFSDRSGQSTAIGMILVLGITIIGTGLVVGLGAQAISETERATDLAQAEHSMTRFDSRTAMVGLGETSSQEITLGTSSEGQFTSSSDDGWISIVHKNYDGTNDEEIYNASLGSVRYVNGDTTIAYQGGGVWRKTDNGSTMVSPPEFHYRGATLTLPIIRVVSEGSASGSTTAHVTRKGSPERIFPNESTDYGGGSQKYLNPVINGTVVVTVHSEFYKGWAQHFRTRTEGSVSVYHSNQTVSVELESVGRVGGFDLTNALDADGLQVRSQSAGHSVEDFTVDFKEDHGTIDNMYFSFHAEQGDHRVEAVVHVDSGTKCNDGGIDSTETLDVYYFYRNLSSGAQHEWSNLSVPADTAPFWVECDGNTATVHANFTSDLAMTYGNVSISDEGTYYDWDGDAAPNADFNHTGEDGEDTRFSEGGANTETDSRHLTRHYFALLGSDFQLRAELGTGSRTNIDVGSSGGVFDYDAGAGNSYITYIHVTENEVEVDFR